MDRIKPYNSTLGIMVCQLNKHVFVEKDFFKYLQKHGQDYKILVYVFFPDYVDWDKRKVKGFQYDFILEKWGMHWFPIPEYIYDRCFYTTSKEYTKYKPYINKLKQDHVTFLGNGLHGKWEVYQILSSHSAYQRYLPKTEIYQGLPQLKKWLAHHQVVLKPIGGSHGKGVIRIAKVKGDYIVMGRDFYNEKIKQTFASDIDFYQWLNRFLRQKRYLIQHYLELTTSQAQPYDIRVLVQKNSEGNWEVTGMAARLGEKENITSNLHGGGTVAQVKELLHSQFELRKATEILNHIKFLAETVPNLLEKYHGDLFEIGLDIGVDTSGGLWLIEANSKPGRRVFSLLGEHEVIEKSKIQPILYTLFLSKKKLGGRIV